MIGRQKYTQAYLEYTFSVNIMCVKTTAVNPFMAATPRLKWLNLTCRATSRFTTRLQYEKITVRPVKTKIPENKTSTIDSVDSVVFG